MKKLLALFFAVVLLLPSLAAANGRYWEPPRHQPPPRQSHGGHHGGGDFLAGVAVATGMYFFWDAVRGSWRPYQPPPPPPPPPTYYVEKCYEIRSEDIWAVDRYGNRYVSGVRRTQVEVPCRY